MDLEDILLLTFEVLPLIIVGTAIAIVAVPVMLIVIALKYTWKFVASIR